MSRVSSKFPSTQQVFFLSLPIWILIFILPTIAHAVLNLNATPLDGSSSLRLGRVDTKTSASQEVRLRINSSEGKQFQIFQRVVQPLTNERGNELNSLALKSYALSGSNAQGTLYGVDPSPLGYADQLLYTSSPNGDSDAFTIIYSVNGQDVEGSGSYLGQILYTVRAIGGGAQQEVFLSVTLEAASGLVFSVEGSSGKDLVRLKCLREDNQSEGYAKISFSGNTGQEIRIYQDMDKFLRDELNSFLGLQVLQFETSGNAQGQIAFPSPSVLERKKVLLYSSKAEADSFTIRYLVSPERFNDQKAGRYQGQLHFWLESDATQERRDLNLELEVASIFKLEVKYPEEGVHFSNLLPNLPPQTKAVLVQVRSNLGKPYLVIQQVPDQMTNERQEKLPQGHFVMKLEPIENSSGKTNFSDFVPVPLGDTPIFSSDAKGSSSQFKVHYRLTAFPEIQPGDYAAPIIYSLQEK